MAMIKPEILEKLKEAHEFFSKSISEPIGPGGDDPKSESLIVLIGYELGCGVYEGVRYISEPNTWDKKQFAILCKAPSGRIDFKIEYFKKHKKRPLIHITSI